MNPEPPSELCAAVRHALVSGSYAEISRDEVEQHLAEHAACADWSTQVILATQILASTPPDEVQPAAFDRDLLPAYVRGELNAEQRQQVEDACCHDLEIVRALRREREAWLTSRVQACEPGVLLRLVREGEPVTEAVLAVDLAEHEFTSLYTYEPQCVAAAESEPVTFDAADGRFVVRVMDRGAEQPGDLHLIELGIRVHEPAWIGSWAGYRVVDARGVVATIGMVRVGEHGSTVRVSLPQTRHGPYTVHVQMLKADTGRLAALYEQLVQDESETPDTPETRQ